MHWMLHVRFRTPRVLQQVAAVEIVRDHSVYYKVRSEAVVVCRQMEFSHFPLDRHICQFRLSSCECQQCFSCYLRQSVCLKLHRPLPCYFSVVQLGTIWG